MLSSTWQKWMIYIRSAIFLMVATFLFCSFPVEIKAQTQAVLQGPLLASSSADDQALILYDLASGQERRLSFGVGTHIMGDFSPDGCQIVFTWEQSPERYVLFVVRIDGSNLRQVAELGRTGAINYRMLEPTWSPDGSKIAFTLLRYYNPADEKPYRETHIAWVTPENSQLNFYSVSGKEWQPRWSPDGSQLAYVSEQPVMQEGIEPTPTPIGQDEDIPVRPEIWITQADGSRKGVFIGFADGGAYNPRWSPDGSQLAFVYEPINQTHRIMVKPVGGGGTRALTRELATVLDFDWRPDGQGVTAAVQGLNDVRENVLWDLSLDTSLRSIRSIPDESLVYLDYPRYSPDGAWLAFRQSYQLGLYHLATGEVEFFESTSQHNSPPVWSSAAFSGEETCGF